MNVFQSNAIGREQKIKGLGHQLTQTPQELDPHAPFVETIDTGKLVTPIKLKMKIEVEVEQILTLFSKQDWINKCPNNLPDKIYERDEFIFIDKNGRFLSKGLDFMVADQNDCYPVKVYRKVFTRQFQKVSIR